MIDKKNTNKQKNVFPEDEIIILSEFINDKTALMSRVIALMMDSEVYLNDTLYEVKKNLIAPIYTGKSLLLFKNNKLVGYASWAFLTEEAEKRYIEDSNSLEVTDWGLGENIWLIDVITPYNSKDTFKLINHLKEVAKEKNLSWKTCKFKRVYVDGRVKIQEVTL